MEEGYSMPAITQATIRIRASAVIVRDEHILLVECNDDLHGLHYNLPGGGVEPGEAVQDAVRREVCEETTADVDVGPLLLVWEFRPEQVDVEHLHMHTIGLIFRASLRDGSEPQFPPAPDHWQTAVRWVPFDELPHVRLLPHVAEGLLEAARSPAPTARFIVEREE